MNNPAPATPSAFDAFYAENGQTPGNAARLAAEDHTANSMKNWAFIEALREAGRLADAAPCTLAALKETAFALESVLMLSGSKLSPAAVQELAKYLDQARAALAKATGA